MSATKLLKGCLSDKEVWYEQMGKILRLLEDRDAVLEDLKMMKSSNNSDNIK